MVTEEEEPPLRNDGVATACAGCLPCFCSCSCARENQAMRYGHCWDWRPPRLVCSHRLFRRNLTRACCRVPVAALVPYEIEGNLSVFCCKRVRRMSAWSLCVAQCIAFFPPRRLVPQRCCSPGCVLLFGVPSERLRWGAYKIALWGKGEIFPCPALSCVCLC